MSDLRFLLVHGSCHGAWCWDRVLPHLAPHAVRATDLPGHGADPTPAAQVTLDLYARAILTAARDMGGPVVLVGHSMAGYPITRAAEIDPTAIARLVYVCAYVPRSGMSLADMRRAGPRQPLRQAIRLAPDGVTFTIDPGQARAVFYHDCSDADAAYAIPRLGPQPVLPQETPMDVTDRSRGLPRHYIRCLDDRTIPPEYQDTMTADWARGTVSTLPCGHSPFFACPGDLAARLIAAARAAI
ncbi:MAG: alpha/beta fold hydrolase [Rhodobacterales bacterium]|nr:alpha/beta fold hydrolase [Rhodobacterales bacterium]